MESSWYNDVLDNFLFILRGDWGRSELDRLSPQRHRWKIYCQPGSTTQLLDLINALVAEGDVQPASKSGAQPEAEEGRQL